MDQPGLHHTRPRCDESLGMCQSQGTCSACFPQPLPLSPVSRIHELCPEQVWSSFNSSWLKFRGKSRLWVNEAAAGSYNFPIGAEVSLSPDG